MQEKKVKILITRFSTPKKFKNTYHRAAKKAGVVVDYATWKDLIIDTKKDKQEILSLNGKKLTDYDIIYIRTIKDKYYEFTQVVNHATFLGIRVVDNSLFEGNRVTDIKIQQISQCVLNGINVPRTVYTTTSQIAKNIDRFDKKPVILKILGLHRGQGVFLVNNKQDVTDVIEKFKNYKHAKGYILQEKINYSQDYRVFVIGNKVMGVIERVPQQGEFRANIARGGQGKAVTKIFPRLEKLALKAANIMKLDIAGVDFMRTKGGKYYLTEINRAPQYKGFMAATGIDIPYEILKYLKTLVS